MAKDMPSSKFSPKVMLEAAVEQSHKGFLQVQESQTRITQEMLEETFIAGFKHCMEVYGITDSDIPGILK